MPFVRVSLPHDLDERQVAAIGDAVHESMVQTFNVPPKDRFQVLTRHAPHELVCTAEYLDIAHGPRVAFVQITCNEGRSVELKTTCARPAAVSAALAANELDA